MSRLPRRSDAGSVLEGGSKVLEQQDQVQGVCRGGLERRVNASIEGRRFGRFGVNQQRTSTDSICHGGRLQERVAHQLSAKPLTLIAEVDTEPGEDDDRDGLSPGPGSQARGSTIRFDSACRERVVAGDPRLAVRRDEVYARRVGLLREQGIALQPRRLRVGAAIEG